MSNFLTSSACRGPISNLVYRLALIISNAKFLTKRHYLEGKVVFADRQIGLLPMLYHLRLYCHGERKLSDALPAVVSYLCLSATISPDKILRILAFEIPY